MLVYFTASEVESFHVSGTGTGRNTHDERWIIDSFIWGKRLWSELWGAIGDWPSRKLARAGDVRCIWDVQWYAGLASRQAVLRLGGWLSSCIWYLERRSEERGQEKEDVECGVEGAAAELHSPLNRSAAIYSTGDRGAHAAIRVSIDFRLCSIVLWSYLILW